MLNLNYNKTGVIVDKNLIAGGKRLFKTLSNKQLANQSFSSLGLFCADIKTKNSANKT